MYQIDDLLHLMARLRDPQYGCPWDLKQTYATIVPYTLEEAYEVADAIERADFEHLPGELGDLLFQVVYYSQLAREEGRFEFAGVVDSITRKLVRRHPHVFPTGDLYAPLDVPRLSEEQVKQRWEEIKAEERAEQSAAPEQLSLLDDVPAALPALSRSAKLQKRAGQVGFDWPDALPVLDKVREELDEVLEAMAENDPVAVADEVGIDPSRFQIDHVHPRLCAGEAEVRDADHVAQRLVRHRRPPERQRLLIDSQWIGKNTAPAVFFFGRESA